MKRLLTIIAIFTLCMPMLHCKKKDGDNKNLNNSNKQPFDIMSTKKGSKWLYKADDGAIFYRYATGLDSFKEGLTYDYFYRVETTSVMKEHIPEYFGKNEGKYLSLIDLDGGEKTYLTYVILKENPYTGQTWTNTERRKMQGWDVDMYIESRVVDAYERVFIDGKIYDSVVHVHNDLKAKSVLMPSYVNCGYLEVWFKVGVGIVKQQMSFNIIDLVKKEYSDQLLDYYIEP